jgi:hypothetical protein
MSARNKRKAAQRKRPAKVRYYSRPMMLQLLSDLCDRIHRQHMVMDAITETNKPNGLHKVAAASLGSQTVSASGLKIIARACRYWKKVGIPAVGTLILKDGKTQPLSPREMSNKIIHAEKIDWDFSKEEPWIICTGEDKEKWVSATINVRDLLWMGAQLGS